MMYNMMDIKLIQERIAVLIVASVSISLHLGLIRLTLDTDAVNTTTSYSSPTRFIN